MLPSKLGGMLASGKPVLVTADAGTELFEVLQGTALLVPAGDAEAVAQGIQKVALARFHSEVMGAGWQKCFLAIRVCVI